MKIAFTSVLFSGVDSNVRQVCHWLAKLGHTVSVVYAGDIPDYLDPLLHFYSVKPGNLHYYASRLRMPRSQVRQIRRRELGHAIASILTQICVEQGLDLAEINDEVRINPNELRGFPFIYKMHGADWLFNRYCEDQNYAQNFDRIQMKMLQTARQVHAVSRSQADFVSGACRISPSVIHITPNPLDTQRFLPSQTPSLGPPYYIMAVGRIERRKGHDILMSAMPKVWQAEPDTHLYVHKGPSQTGMAELDSIVPESVHQGRIHYIGHISEDDLIAHYNQAHVYVSAARYETFGYTILEAMSCGRPVIASDIGPIPELVRHGETGWLAPVEDVDSFANAIIDALRHRDIAERYGQEGRRLAQKYDIEPVMRKQLGLYEKAVSHELRG